jgi:hypothetical protein
MKKTKKDKEYIEKEESAAFSLMSISMSQILIMIDPILANVVFDIVKEGFRLAIIKENLK